MRRGQRSKAALPRWLLGVVRGLWGGSRLLKVAKKASPKKVAGKQVERVEASKTGRASCKLCKQKIIKGELGPCTVDHIYHMFPKK